MQTGLIPWDYAGAAYVFHKNQGGTDNWGQVKKIVATNRAANDEFGHSVSVSGSYILVGAKYEDEDEDNADSLINAGAAFVFYKDQGGTNNWGLAKQIVSSDRAKFDEFGHTVLISGPYAIVGARLEDQDASGSSFRTSAGSAYIFHKDEGGTDSWGQIQKVVASDRNDADAFSFSLAISKSTILIGVPEEDEDVDGNNTLNSAGSVYFFNTDLPEITILGTDSTDFGNVNVGDSATLTFTMVNDGSQTLDISSITSNNSCFVVDHSSDSLLAGDSATFTVTYIPITIINQSAIVHIASNDPFTPDYTLEVSGTGQFLDSWSDIIKSVASDREQNDLYGFALDIDGDYAVIGSPFDDGDNAGMDSLQSAGSVYVFYRNQGGKDNWGQVKKITASDRAYADQFGNSVSISGDYVVVGANHEDEDEDDNNTLSKAGSAYVFHRNQGGDDNWGTRKKKSWHRIELCLLSLEAVYLYRAIP